MSKSCAGCKYFYGNGSGYSNYTWMETIATCALGNADFGGADVPYDWNRDPDNDNWNVTKDSRCGNYERGPYLVLDPDRECRPSSYSKYWETLGFMDVDQYRAIASSDDWEPMPFDEYMRGGKD